MQNADGCATIFLLEFIEECDLVLREYLKRNKKAIIDFAILLVILVVISFASLLLLRAFDVLQFDADGIYLNVEMFDDFRSSWYGWIIIIALQMILTMLLCFVPGASMAFIVLISMMYTKSWQAFLISFIGVMLTSFTLYMMGRLGGYRICRKLLGDKDCEKASDLLNNKGAVYFPLMMMFPIFPDDALVMIAGTLKMSLKWFIPSIVLGRGIGIATIVFGLLSVPFDKLTTPWHWIGFVLLCLIFLIAVFWLAGRFNKFLETRHKDKKDQE